jgi:hypothetical protein
LAGDAVGLRRGAGEHGNPHQVGTVDHLQAEGGDLLVVDLGRDPAADQDLSQNRQTGVGCH